MQHVRLKTPSQPPRRSRSPRFRGPGALFGWQPLLRLLLSYSLSYWRNYLQSAREWNTRACRESRRPRIRRRRVRVRFFRETLSGHQRRQYQKQYPRRRQQQSRRRVRPTRVWFAESWRAGKTPACPSTRSTTTHSTTKCRPSIPWTTRCAAARTGFFEASYQRCHERTRWHQHQSHGHRRRRRRRRPQHRSGSNHPARATATAKPDTIKKKVSVSYGQSVGGMW